MDRDQTHIVEPTYTCNLTGRTDHDTLFIQKLHGNRIPVLDDATRHSSFAYAFLEVDNASIASQICRLL